MYLFISCDIFWLGDRSFICLKWFLLFEVFGLEPIDLGGTIWSDDIKLVIWDKPCGSPSLVFAVLGRSIWISLFLGIYWEKFSYPIRKLDIKGPLWSWITLWESICWVLASLLYWVLMLLIIYFWLCFPDHICPMLESSWLSLLDLFASDL